MLNGYKTYLSILGAFAFCAYGVATGNMDFNTAANIMFPMLGIGGLRHKQEREE